MTYTAYIKSQPCLICGKKAQASHQRILGSGGTSLKPHDVYQVPLCDEHHKEEHRGAITFWLKYYMSVPVPKEMRKETVQLIVYKIITELMKGYLDEKA